MVSHRPVQLVSQQFKVPTPKEKQPIHTFKKLQPLIFGICVWKKMMWLSLQSTSYCSCAPLSHRRGLWVSLSSLCRYRHQRVSQGWRPGAAQDDEGGGRLGFLHRRRSRGQAHILHQSTWAVNGCMRSPQQQAKQLSPLNLLQFLHVT